VRRVTHLALGAAVAVPVVLQQPLLLGTGCLLIGAIGGGVPDWIDFRSGIRRPFTPRHRGASHGLPVMVLCLALIVVALLLIRGRFHAMDGIAEALANGWVPVLLIAFGAGWLSHLASDACTVSGIQPFLPLSRWRCWLLPRRLRSRSDGYLDKLVRLAAFVVLGFGIVLMVSRWWEG
jgi:membrane-bound metal-dependent hydrolase YbcI (DUF457 family)